jgi:aspartyl-tRNA(Asn)/glutamyl-tRNA(Gln) amidotransferase subunit C
MSITAETVVHLAKLSRLHFEESEILQYTKDLGAIFEYAKALSDLNTESILPSAHAIPSYNVFREDTVSPFNSDLILDNAPEAERHAFKVPQILVD